MADSMCGPSNAAKGLVAHANRDRSIHQDRFVASQAAGNANFRSQASFGQGNGEAEFLAFQSGMAPQMTNNVGGIEPMQLPGPSGYRNATKYGNALNLDVMAVTEYQRMMEGQARQQNMTRMNAQMGHLTVAPATQQQQHVGQQPVGQQHMGQQHMGQQHMGQQNYQQNYQPAAYAPYSANAYSATGFGASAAFAPTSFGTYGHAQQMQVPAQSVGTAFGLVQPAVAHMDDEAFARAFDEIEDATENDQEFNEAMGEWMQRHGPAAELRAAQAAALLEALDDEQDMREEAANRPVIDPQLVADEARQQEVESKKSNEQHELARAASEIIASVEGNDSDKFKKSSFLDLMRRIGANEVVVEANALVDSETGAVVVSRPHEEMDDFSEGPSNAPENMSKSEGKKVDTQGHDG